MMARLKEQFSQQPILAPIFVALSSLCMVLGTLAVANDAPTPIRSESLGGGVHVLYGAGGNVAISAGDDGVFMVDDQFAPQVPLLKQAIAKITDQPLRFLLNTHWHYDHTGGNERIGAGDTLIVAHDNVRRRLSTDQFIEFFNKQVPALDAKGLPVITFDRQAGFHVNGGEIRLIHVPHAHTDGDAMVHFKAADVIHMGDTFFNGLYPFIDLGSGGNLNGMIAAAELALALTGPSSKIIPGHGPVTDKAGLQAYHEMLTGVRSEVQALIAAGKNRDQIIAAKPTAAWDEKWGNGFIPPEVMAGFAVDSLTQ